MEYDKEMLDEFVSESREHLETIEDDFLNLETQKHNPDPELVNKVFRAIHTVKGCAGFLGMTNINKLSHVMETLLSMVRDGEILPESKFLDPLLEGVDMLNAMLDNAEHSNEMDMEEIYGKLTNLLSTETPPMVKNELDTTIQLSDVKGVDVGFDITEFTLKNIEPDEFLYVLKYDLIEFTKKGGKSPVALIKQLLSAGTIVEAQIETTSDDLHNGIPEGPLRYDVLYSTKVSMDNIFNTVELPESLIVQVEKDGLKKGGSDEDIKKQEDASEEKKLTTISPQPSEPAKPPASQTTAAPAPQKSSTSSERSNTIRINVEILDQLMMLAGELVLVRNQQLLSVDKSDPVSRSIAQRLDIVTSELQESIMRTRMQPIGNVFSKFNRVVRDLGNKLNKQIEIDISGEEVELDKTILESLADPLTHLIRNCCDHGIELPEDRVKAGKPRIGRVSLQAYHEGGQINIEIIDDGKGINVEAIKRKVLEKQLKTEAELARMKENEIQSLILLPGFSTAEQISDVSGRGVGMDVVKSNIEKLGGIIDIESKYGEGSKMHLRLPLTLAIIPCLIVMVGEHRYAVPQINLEELVCLYDDNVRTKIECAGNKEVYRLRDTLLPMVRMTEVLKRPSPFTDETKAEITEMCRKQQEDMRQATPAGGLPAENKGRERVEINNDRGTLSDDNVNLKSETRNTETSQSLNFAVLKVGANRFGLIVDGVLGTEEIVVKPMHPAVKSLGCYSGATVMGDGKVALILDVDGIARHARIELNGRTDDAGAVDHIDKGNETQSVLIFKNGAKEQFAVALPLVKRIERISVSKIEHVGEKMFITIDGVSTLILRLDHHMKVSPCIEKEEMYLMIPKHVKKPFGILISGIVDIEESTVNLNTESYMEDGLLGTAIVKDHITLFIDIFKLIEIAEPSWFANRQQQQSSTEKKTRVLLVEDTPFFLQLIKGYLVNEGFEVVTATDGQAGLSLINEKDFDLIVSDIEMPVMNGFDFLKNVRSGKRQSDIPAIAVTALDSDEDRDKAVQCGFNRYETKFNRDTFLASVEEIIGH